ncbi:uncharacterized protein BJ171DRAFT_473531 [Polychytrium aggregatum]|uniref:uncharacterized protein n=1 Tax=Polychytrium aggregatum TaxID=110093 RepID=UPI0022FEDAB2|nr:uncharacterized protein BJ171DRAFT_473531 [Polychytrium aggregatum]KAI9206541.1 hypothetical protein BJ171DRAFT_473531 [Polychytrium aggregatum]
MATLQGTVESVSAICAENVAVAISNTEGWLKNNNLLGVTSGHLLLAIALVASSVVSVSKVIKNYRRGTGALELVWNWDIHNMHLLSQACLLVYGLVSVGEFISFHQGLEQPLVILAAVDSLVLNIVQHAMALLAFWPIIRSSPTHRPTFLPMMVAIATLPTVVYTVAVCVYATTPSSDANAVSLPVSIAKYAWITAIAARGLTSILSIALECASRFALGHYSPTKIQTLNLIFALANAANSVFSILFALGLACPVIQVSESDVWIDYKAWQSFVTLWILVSVSALSPGIADELPSPSHHDHYKVPEHIQGGGCDMVVTRVWNHIAVTDHA